MGRWDCVGALAVIRRLKHGDCNKSQAGLDDVARLCHRYVNKIGTGNIDRSYSIKLTRQTLLLVILAVVTFGTCRRGEIVADKGQEGDDFSL